MSSPFLDASELAVLLRMSPWTIKEWARRTGPDGLPTYKAGKRLVFLEAEAVEWFTRTQRRQPVVPMPARRLRRQRRGAGRARLEVQRAT